MDYTTLFTNLLAIVTLLGNLAAFGLLLFFLIRRSIYDRLMDFLAKWGLELGFAISFASTVGSLIYSEVAGFAACILCWIQRIFMYPLPFLFGLALWKKDKGVAPYALLLALVGGAVALYQWVKDMLALYGNVSLACPEVAGLPSCDKIYVLEYGYITIPMIALNAFIWLALITFAALRRARS